MFVYGDVVYAQTWQVLTLKNCIEPFSYASTAYVVASALVSVRPICKNLSNLQKIFGQMVYRLPLAKNSPYAFVLDRQHGRRDVTCKREILSFLRNDTESVL